jgi:hypothetical protein
MTPSSATGHEGRQATFAALSFTPMSAFAPGTLIAVGS